MWSRRALALLLALCSTKVTNLRDAFAGRVPFVSPSRSVSVCAVRAGEYPHNSNSGSLAISFMLIASLMSMLFGATFGGVGHTVFALIGALLFCGFILYDTSNLIHVLGPDDYIIAAVQLYLDIINLFLYLLEILRMLQGGNSD